MQTVESFIHELKSESQREIVTFLHTWLVEDLGLVPKIRYRVPFYYQKTWMIYLSPTKKGVIDFSFIRGHQLSEEHTLLESRGRKMVKSLEIISLDTLPYEALEAAVQEAILIDKTIPNKISKSKKG